MWKYRSCLFPFQTPDKTVAEGSTMKALLGSHKTLFDRETGALIY
jgi:hypothetical protein